MWERQRGLDQSGFGSGGTESALAELGSEFFYFELLYCHEFAQRHRVECVWTLELEVDEELHWGEGHINEVVTTLNVVASARRVHSTIDSARALDFLFWMAQ